MTVAIVSARLDATERIPMTLRIDDERVGLLVALVGPTRDRKGRLVRPLHPSEFGWDVIERLADRWGMADDPPRMWFELDVDAKDRPRAA